MAGFLTRDVKGRFISPKRASKALASGVFDKDLGYQDALRNLLGLGRMRPEIVVGVPASAGADVVLYAAVNEFGTQDGRIPERSYLRSTYDENKQRYGDLVADAILVGIKKGRGPFMRTMRLIGAAQVGDVQRKIETFSDPPNAPSTIRKKGFDDPLVETGRLGRSITFFVNV